MKTELPVLGPFVAMDVNRLSQLVQHEQVKVEDLKEFLEKREKQNDSEGSGLDRTEHS